MLALLRTFSWQDLRHHPWRSAAAVAAVMLGVALAFAVHVINASALDEFSQAVRAVNGQPDLEVRPMQGTLPESLFAQVATHPDVARANPVLEATAMASPAVQTSPATAPTALRLLGADALLLPAMAPALMPRPWEGAARDALFAPATVYLNPAALQALGVPPEGSQPRPTLQLQTGLHNASMLALLRTFSWQDLRHHPWRSAAAVAAVMLGVALAFAVHVINASALDEFSQADLRGAVAGAF